jgi:hypothetical protein
VIRAPILSATGLSVSAEQQGVDKPHLPDTSRDPSVSASVDRGCLSYRTLGTLGGQHSHGQRTLPPHLPDSIARLAGQ